MSTEEQDQILGRLTRESQESRRRLAALEAKMQDFRSRLTEVTKTLTGFMEPNATGTSGAITRAIAAAKEMPDRQALLDALGETRVEHERLDAIHTQLSKFE